MLLVVFGAGASYDSNPSQRPIRGTAPQPHRLPLADELFADRPTFVRFMDQFPECKPIIPYLRRPDNRSVEQVLEELQGETEEFGDRLPQITAIRFYLRHMIGECENQWNQEAHGITNYKTLLDEIHRWLPKYKDVCFVTFNYDTMIETALKERLKINLSHINDYATAASNYKLIKLHGSVNWVREINSPFTHLQTQSDLEVCHEIIERISALDVPKRYHVSNPPSAVTDGPKMNAYFPAIAIPVETKDDYECPQNHVQVLEACILKTTRVIVIGWKAMDKPFLGLLRKLPQQVPVMVVSGSSQGAREVQERLNAAFVGGRFQTAESGFTPFVVERGVSRFLSG